MDKTNKTELFFYQKLSELFNAISTSDQLVKEEEEYNTLAKSLKKNRKTRALR
jgi:hypothetical protein